MTTAAARRPTGVTVVAVILFIQVIAGIVGGIALIIERNNDSLLSHVDLESNEVAAYGTVGIVWGVIALFVALGLWKGANWARFLVAVVEVIGIAGGVYVLVQWDGTHATNGIAQIVIGALVVVGILTIFAVGIPALDEAVKKSSGFAVGSAYTVSETTSFTPAPGWEIDPTGTTPGQVVTAHKNGWTLKVIGALEVPPDQTPEEFMKIFWEGDKSNHDEFTQVSDIESFVTASGQTGGTWTAHGPQDAAQQWDVADGTSLGQMRADGTAANLDTVQSELDEMARSIVVTARSSGASS